MSNGGGKITNQSTVAIIAERLRSAIGHGEILPDSQLHEAELVENLGVSRGPLREAMQRLTQEGLLIAVRNKGVFVVGMTPDRVRDMYVARLAIERTAAEQILLNGHGMTACATLLTVVDEMRIAISHQRIDMITDADMKFHQCLVSMAQSPRLNRMQATLLTETQMCITALEVGYQFDDSRIGEHRDIARAFALGDWKPGSRFRHRAELDKLLVAHMSDAVERLSVQLHGDER